MNKKIFVFFYGLNSLGQNFYYLAIPMIIYNITKSASYMGIMTIVQTVPAILFGTIVGATVDRFESKILLEITLFSQTFFLIIIYGLSLLENHILFIYIFAFLLSVNRQFFKSCIFTLVPGIFNNVKRGNEIISSLNSLAGILAPFIGAGIIALLGVNFTLLMNLILTFSFLIIIFFSDVKSNLSIEEHEAEEIYKKSILSDTIDGFLLIKKNKLIRHVTIIVLFSNLADAGLIQLLIFYMSHDLDISQSLISTVVGISSIGAFVGTFVSRLFSKLKDEKVMLVGLLINNLGIFLLLIPNWKFITCALFISRIGGMIFFIMQNTVVHTTVNKNMYGRINGVISNLSELSTPVSVFLLMSVANFLGGYYAICLSCIFTAIVSVMAIVYAAANKEKV